MLLDNLLDLGLLEVLELILLEVKDDSGTATNSGGLLVELDGEGTAGRRLPNVLLVVIVLGDDLDAIGDKVCRVETNTKLTDQGHVDTGIECLHELLGTGASNGTKVVDEVSLGETNTGILAIKEVSIPISKHGESILAPWNIHDEGLVLLVGNNVDPEVLLGVQHRGVAQRLVSDLVKSIGSIGNQFTQEDCTLS